jgi:hypothetical protein
MLSGVFGLSENVRALIDRRVELTTLSCTVVVSSMRSTARADQRYRCLWRSGDCREERASATVLASGGRRWEIPSHAGPVVTGPRGELPLDAMTDPRAMIEGCDVRLVDEDAGYEGRAVLVVEVERPRSVRGYDRVLTLDAEFGIVLVDRDLVSGRQVRLAGVRFNEELDPGLFDYRPEPWRTLIHAQPC